MTITSFAPANLQILRQEMTDAMAEIAKKHGIKISIGKMTYSNEAFHTKLEAMVIQKGEGSINAIPGEVKWQKDFLQNYMYVGFKKEDLGRKIKVDGEMMMIVGLRPRAKCNVVLQKPQGGFTAISADYAKRCMA